MANFYVLITGQTPELLSAAVVTASYQGYIINGPPFTSGSTLVQNMLLQQPTYPIDNPERLSKSFRANNAPTSGSGVQYA